MSAAFGNDYDQRLQLAGGSSDSGSSTRGSSPDNGSGNVASSASRTASDSAASHHSPTASNLNSRGIIAMETKWVHDFDGPDQCRKTSQAFFDALCPGVREVKVYDEAYEALLDVFDSPYSSETEFNEKLFKAVGTCIRGLSTKRQFKFSPHVLCTENLIVLVPKKKMVIGTGENNGMEYAVGLVREKAPPMDRRCILSRRAKLDHAAVMLRRVANSSRFWGVWNALAVVDFKIQGKGVRNLATNADGSVRRKLLDPLKAQLHGALVQVIMYTAAHALRGAAALGQLPKCIPFAVISCKKEEGGGSRGDEESNWVHGNLVVPEVCGFPYTFNVDAYGKLVNAQRGNYSSLAAYLHVMTHGVNAASAWLEQLERASAKARQSLRKAPAPHWMSGQYLHFGRATPLTGGGQSDAPPVLAATPVSKYGKNGLRVAQGELFKVTVNLRNLRSSVSTRDGVFWCQDTYEDKETSALVKVSTLSCFHLLVPTERAYLYSTEEDVWELRKDVRDVLSGSLYGFYVTPRKHGLVQLMPNLVKQGYEALRPERWLFADLWSVLWDSFERLVTGTLIPLTRYHIVHVDLRAGCDVTSNILYNPTTGSMLMIDLDSLCSFSSLGGMTAVFQGDRIICPVDLPPQMQNSALGFVLGQVICVAESWHKELRDEEINANDIINKAVESNTDVKVAADVDYALITRVLAHYKREIRGKYGTRRTGRDVAAG
jgi:hypothetical protein